jgi:hypothetical protein
MGEDNEPLRAPHKKTPQSCLGVSEVLGGYAHPGVRGFFWGEPARVNMVKQIFALSFIPPARGRVSISISLLFC